MLVLVPVTGILLGILCCILPLKLFILFFTGLLYLGICIVNLKYGLFMTLLLRSSMDYFSSYTFTLPSIGDLNIAAFMGVLIIVLAVFAILTRDIQLGVPLIGLFMLFLCLSAIPSIVFAEIGASLQKWLKFASLASFYLLVYNYAKKDSTFILKLLDLTIYSSVIPLALGALQFATDTGNKTTIGLNRLNGTFVHPNPFAFYLLIIIAACLIRIYNGGSRQNILYKVILAAALIELVFTYTRGAWLGLLLMSGIIFLRIRNRKKIRFLFAGALCLLPFAAIMSTRFTGILSSRMEDSSLATRFHIWTNMFSLSLNSPFIGHGLGTFEVFAEKAIGWHIEAHNEYLRMLFETGIIGLTAYLLLMVSALVYTYGLRKSRSSIINVIVFSLFLTFMAMSLADNIADNLVSQWYLWAFTAISIANKTLRREVHESACHKQIPLSKGWKRNLLFFIKQTASGKQHKCYPLFNEKQ